MFYLNLLRFDGISCLYSDVIARNALVIGTLLIYNFQAILLTWWTSLVYSFNHSLKISGMIRIIINWLTIIGGSIKSKQIIDILQHLQKHVPVRSFWFGTGLIFIQVEKSGAIFPIILKFAVNLCPLHSGIKYQEGEACWDDRQYKTKDTYSARAGYAPHNDCCSQPA